MSYKPSLPDIDNYGEAKFNATDFTVNATGLFSFTTASAYGWKTIGSYPLGATALSMFNVTNIPTFYQQYLLLFTGISVAGQGIINLTFSPDNFTTAAYAAEYVIYGASSTTSSVFDILSNAAPPTLNTIRIGGNYSAGNATGKMGFIQWAPLGNSGNCPFWSGCGSNVATQYQTFGTQKGVFFNYSPVNAIRMTAIGTTIANGTIYLYGV